MPQEIPSFYLDISTARIGCFEILEATWYAMCILNSYYSLAKVAMKFTMASANQEKLIWQTALRRYEMVNHNDIKQSYIFLTQ